ncbi:glycosyltransferase family 4 protein [Cerasicoccus maritimus]|uniref:glycosyltransferase family 4 protein n=1 Tax=Cerasicoccus maritimus TaxID=490089 RepID=UPI002852900C|nr:glycosyltransferase family 4 protein [Cerasicoccus maritimus]
MKIMTISNLYPPHHVGGYEVRCQQVMDRLRGRGHEVHVLTSNHAKPGVTEPDPPGIERALRIHGFFGHPWLPMHQLLELERENHATLIAAIKRVQPDVIHVWNMGGISKSLLHRLEDGNIPVVYDISDHWIARSLKGDVWLDWWNRRARGGSGLLRMLAELLAQRRKFDRDAPTYPVERIAWKHIYFCSAFLRQLTLDAGYKVGHGSVIYCGVETAKFEHKTDYSEFKRLLFVGRLSEDKDPLTAIRGVAKARAQGLDVTLDLYGKGDQEYVQQLHDSCADLKLGNAVQFKSCTPEEMRRVYSQYDALLFTSNWGEPFALTPLEAMAARLPVILVPDGGDVELGRDGENCVLAEAANPESLASGIKRLHENPTLRQQIAKSAGTEVDDQYDLKPISEQIESFLENVLRESRG